MTEEKRIASQYIKELRSCCMLHTVDNLDMIEAREHIAVRPFGCGLWLWHTHDLLKKFAAIYEVDGDLKLSEFWKDFETFVIGCIIKSTKRYSNIVRF
tara:strand:+ start:774 stop:1067 length:294 start_codon:yes stop_codon:yes gene_type:complete